jgi:hypothetical protein
MLPPSPTTTTPWLAALALASLTRVANAEPATGPSARLEVPAESDCGTREYLVARVHARAPKIRFVEETTEVGIRAQFVALPTGRVEGVLVLTPEGGTAITRRLVARSCAEAADGLALIIAVALGQAVSSAAGEGGKDGAASTPGTSSDAAAGGREGPNGGRTDGPNETRVRDGNPPDGAPERSDPPDAAGSSFTLDVGLFAQGLLGPAPQAMPGIAVHALAVWGHGVLAPAVALGATHAARSGLSQPGGTAVFVLDAAMLDLCPLRLELGAVDVHPCAATWVGRLSVAGRATRNAPGKVARTFATAGGSLVVMGRLGWVLEPSLRASLGANLARDSFTFTPVVFHRVPPLSASLSVGLDIVVF